MKFIELAHRRFSLRNYSPRPVEPEKLERCLEAARLAPSACNSQPWYFITVQSEPLRSRLAKAAVGGIYKMNRFALNAPVLIVLVRKHSRYVARLGGTLRKVQYSLIDLGIAGEHLALQAAEEGLNTCWLGWFNEKAVRKELGLARHEKIDILFSLGYAADETTREKKRLAMDEICEYR